MTAHAEPAHPAKFSGSIQKALAGWVDREAARRDLDRPLRVLDPFAGVGRIHRLPFEREHFTVGGELEIPWALSGGSIPADATRLPFGPESFDVIATSPCYGNRMADTYDGSRDTCGECAGTGCRVESCVALHLKPVAPEVIPSPHGACENCDGTGFAASRRQTYRIALGQKLREGSAAGLQWGPAYRRLHVAAWEEARRVLAPGGLLLVNISNHVRARKIQHVAEWHLVVLLRAGMLLVEAAPLETPRMRHGANYELRPDAELLLVLRDPRPHPEENPTR